MKRIFTTLILAIALIVPGLANAQDCYTPIVVAENGVQTQTIYAGQNIDAGNITIYVDGDNLNVTFTATDGWEFTETHLWVGQSLADLPATKKGNPSPGQFPYKSGDITGEVTSSFLIPLEDVGFVCSEEEQVFYVAAHSALRKWNDYTETYQTETGWGDGPRIVHRGSWATYFTVTLVCVPCEEPEEEYTDETAFAYGGDYATGFDQYGFSRWGWTNGPLGEGAYVFDIYAGAAQNNLDKGVWVGTLTVEYVNGTVTVLFDVDDPFVLGETQVYVGNDPLPTGNNGNYTVAPGSYGNGKDADDPDRDIYVLENVTGYIYVVAHAVVSVPVSAW